jgi:hypothetical protein
MRRRTRSRGLTRCRPLDNEESRSIGIQCVKQNNISPHFRLRGVRVCRITSARRSWNVTFKGGSRAMRMKSAIATLVCAMLVLAGSTVASRAESGYVELTIYKAGWIIGGSGGSGYLSFRGRTYGLTTGGLDYGLVFGGSKTFLSGRVRRIRRPSDIEGVYVAGGAGIAVGGGARAIILTNQKGAVLELSGRQIGLLANLDLSGLAITLD